MHTSFHQATLADAATLVDLARRTIDACYRSFLGDDAVDGFIGSGAVDRYVEANIDFTVVITCDEKIVGFACWRDELIDLMMIDHTLHRQGLGTQLITHVETMLFEAHDEIRLNTFTGNERTVAFYRKNGWHETSRFQDEASGSEKIVFVKSRPA